jgi:hypothetical protein
VIDFWISDKTEQSLQADDFATVSRNFYITIYARFNQDVIKRLFKERKLLT